MESLMGSGARPLLDFDFVAAFLRHFSLDATDLSRYFD